MLTDLDIVNFSIRYKVIISLETCIISDFNCVKVTMIKNDKRIEKLLTYRDMMHGIDNFLEDMLVELV